MDNYATTTFVEHLRLAILKLLANESGGYSANDSMLTDGLRELGFRLSRDKVRTELHWLAEQGLLAVESIEHLVSATISRRGLEVASGEIRVPGVKRPSPKE